MSFNIPHQKALRASNTLKKTITKPNKKNKPLKKKQQLSVCHYETIPFPLKYNSQDHALIYGNIPLAQKNNTFCCDFSMLNRFHIYRDIKVVPYQEQRLLLIKTERRSDARFSRWKTVLKKISKTKNSSLMKWNKIIKKFSHIYEKQMKEYNTKMQDQLMKESESTQQKEAFDLYREQRENKKRTLLTKYPCIQLRTVFRGFENRLTEIIINEKLTQTLGYKIDSFISLTLSEGLPQVFKLDEENDNATFLQNLLKSYCTTEAYDHQTPEFDVMLVTKSCYARRAKVQVYFLMNQFEESCGSDTLFVITWQGAPFMPEQNNIGNLQLNESFVDVMRSKEIDTSQFLHDFYNYQYFPAEYLNLDKVCRIKEIVDTDYICKAEDYP